MGSYSLRIKPAAVKELETVPVKDRRRLVTRIRHLARDPRPAGSEKLTGYELHRIRQGDYRVVYEISDQERTVTIFKIGHRREIDR